MKNCRIINGETPLPEAMIHHIQSFMSGKEAAQTTLISKSWYYAWLTRPSIDLDDRHFAPKFSFEFYDRLLPRDSFKQFAIKTMTRYIESSLKIDSFRLYRFSYRTHLTWIDELIVNAIKIGATDLTLETSYAFNLPPELLRSQIHLTLSLSSCRVDADCIISYSGLKSLNLSSVRINESKFEHMIKCCCNSLEELSLSRCTKGLLDLALTDGYELHKLRRLFLSSVDVGTCFSTNFASRFPCLKDLSIIECHGCEKIRIASSSLQTINIKPIKSTWSAKFDVPNIRSFTLSCSGLPSQLSIKGGSREWEFDISIVCNMFHMSSWFQTLKKCLTKFRLARITLSITLFRELLHKRSVDRVYDNVVREPPLVVENLLIDDVPSSYCSALLIRLLGAFRPKFITHYWVTKKCDGWFFKNDCLDMICMRLMQLSICPSWGIPNQNMFGRFALDRVNLDVFEMVGGEWRPFPLTTHLDASEAPANTRKVRFELIWKN